MNQRLKYYLSFWGTDVIPIYNTVVPAVNIIYHPWLCGSVSAWVAEDLESISTFENNLLKIIDTQTDTQTDIHCQFFKCGHKTNCLQNLSPSNQQTVSLISLGLEYFNVSRTGEDSYH
ncbi:hypothetical protein OUZ56_024861 [Daphnia magna]|uniref:Uncharacterized protein n=1 Tax=Daphnia magna TaxID=35525 RepID=A0ABQ9ZI74_9CRUS|nr:hypothetical protein OUZ56_024861 [Daphnia magna]